jgi:hypothetical protein
MAYKGWTEKQWEEFFSTWKKADDASKRQLMSQNSIYFFDWTACNCAYANDDNPHMTASELAEVSEMLDDLSITRRIGSITGAAENSTVTLRTYR